MTKTEIQTLPADEIRTIRAQAIEWDADEVVALCDEVLWEQGDEGLVSVFNVHL